MNSGMVDLLHGTKRRSHQMKPYMANGNIKTILLALIFFKLNAGLSIHVEECFLQFPVQAD